MIRIGTRGSQLALWQANAVASALAGRGLATEIVVVRTTGDRLGEAPLAEVGGKRLFVKEIEDALLEGRVDLAVHSAKDMPTELPEGLAIGAMLPRAEPWDALVLPAERRREGEDAEEGELASVVAALGATARVGTSSVRRVTQLHRLLPEATFHPIRGNLDTRLRKLDEGQFDAIVLACAGLLRLGAADRITARLPLTACVPAPGQGAIAIQHRTDANAVLRDAVAALGDRATLAAVTAERMVVRVLGGGCQTPIGALALAHGDDLELHATVTGFEGAELRAVGFGTFADASGLGERVGAKLLAEGAADLLDASAVEMGDE